MKKFLFSAIALTAFSFASMANNDGKELKTETQIEIEVKINTMKEMTDLFPWHCANEYFSVYNELVDDFGHDEAVANASAYLQYCVENTY